MSIIISKNGKGAEKIERLDFEKENSLQEYILANPDSIPVYDIDADKRLFVAAREFSTESGPIDALAIDQDGDIYIVETKLFRNPDKRNVVAQALDYGAALWKHSGEFSRFLGQLDAKVRPVFGMSFQEKAKGFFGLTDDETASLLEAMRRNLFEGNLKFVVLMDSIDDRLKDLIVYINQNSEFDIYAVQLEYYKHDAFEIMIPKIFGVEVKKNVSTGSQQTQYDEVRNEFWKQFIAEASGKSSIFSSLLPAPKSWCSVPLIRGVGLGLDVLKDHVRVSIETTGKSGDDKTAFDFLFQQKDQLEKDFGSPLAWERQDGSRRSHISVRLDDLDCYDKVNWSKVNAFLMDSAIRMEKAFKPHLQKLK